MSCFFKKVLYILGLSDDPLVIHRYKMHCILVKKLCQKFISVVETIYLCWRRICPVHCAKGRQWFRELAYLCSITTFSLPNLPVHRSSSGQTHIYHLLSHFSLNSARITYLMVHLIEQR